MIYEATVPMRRTLKDIAVVEPTAPWPEPALPRPEVPPADSPVPATILPSREEIEVLERLHERLDDLTQDLWAQQRQRLTEMQRVAVELAVAIASRLIHQRIEEGDLGVQNLVRQVAERLEPQDALTVYLHPADLSLLQQQVEPGQQWFPGEGKLKLAVDESLSRGDCRAETGDMSLLLKLDKQLEDVRKHLLDVLPEVDVEQRKPQPGDRQLRRFPERRHIA